MREAIISCQTATGQCNYLCPQGYVKCPELLGCFNSCPPERQPRGSMEHVSMKQGGQPIDHQHGTVDARTDL